MTSLKGAFEAVTIGIREVAAMQLLDRKVRNLRRHQSCQLELYNLGLSPKSAKETLFASLKSVDWELL